MTVVVRQEAPLPKPRDENGTASLLGLATSELTPRAFCRLFLHCVIAGFLAVVVVNFAVNPRGQYSPSFLQPLVLPSRQQKVALYGQLSEPPQGLVLGSSRVMKFEPDYLAQRLGHSFFNAGMNYAKPEDVLAFLRLAIEDDARRHNPLGLRTMVLGLDVSSFSEHAAVDARLVANETLSRLVPETRTLGGYHRRWQDLISWSQTAESARSVARTIKRRGVAQPKETYRSDGVLIYHERERQLAEGTYQLAPAIAYNEHEYTELMRGYDRLSPTRCALFAKIVELCHDHEIALTVFLPPFHPELRRTLLEKTVYRERHKEVLGFLSDLTESRSFKVFDFSTIDSFGGKAEQFVDGIHPLEPNTRAMVDVMFPMQADTDQPSRDEGVGHAIQ